MSPDVNAVPAVVATWLGRAALISVGLVIARRKDPPEQRRRIARDALAGALALEGFLLAYAAYNTHGPGRARALEAHHREHAAPVAVAA